MSKPVPKRRRTPWRFDLKPDPKNANLGTDRGRAAIAHSLRELGAGRSILADRHGYIIAGNKTAEQAQALQIPVRVVKSAGDELIVVQREDLDLGDDADPRARALAIADNRTGELDLAWDPKMLKALHDDGLDLSVFWGDAELAALFGTSTVGRTDENAVVAPGATDIVRGDFFALGPHRLLCGDATDPADVGRLLNGADPIVMSTDTPYGVNYGPLWRHKAYPGQRTAVGTVLNDTNADWTAAFKLFHGPVCYAWHASLFAAVAARALESTGFVLRAQIVWVKQHFALSRGDYHYQHEPAWYAVRKGATSHWQGDRTQATVWQVPNLSPVGGTRTDDNAPTGHSTQKPVRLFEIPILNHTTPGQAVYKPLVGSGTTLIAAEKTGRVAYVMDLDPQYVQVAVTRWEAFTGRRARRLTTPVGRRRS